VWASGRDHTPIPSRRERDVQRLLTLRRSVVARYYSEWGVADTTERVEDVRPASRSEADLIRVPPPVE
jgi:hypothetical protein